MNKDIFSFSTIVSLNVEEKNENYRKKKEEIRWVSSLKKKKKLAEYLKCN